MLKYLRMKYHDVCTIKSLWLCGSQKLWKILKGMGIPDHLTSLLRNMYAGQAAAVRTGHGIMDWFQTEKERQSCILSPCLFYFHAEYIMGMPDWRNEVQAGIKIPRKNINNLRYADDTILTEKARGTKKKASLWNSKRRVKTLAYNSTSKNWRSHHLVPSLHGKSDQIRSDQSLSHVQLFATPWITAHQASLSITNSWSSLRLTSIESVMPSSHLILCRPLLLLPPSIRVFSNESTLRMRWPKYWSFSFSIIPSKEIPGLISFRMDWLDLHAVQGTLKSLL